MALALGTLLGSYEIGAPLGAGGMGEVYRARDIRLDRTVAIKVLPKQLSNDPVSKQRFEREAKTISSLNHPNICALYDVGHQDGIDYLVMECVEGGSLAERLQKGPLPLDQVLKYGAQISFALDQAHRSGVVHRDLKPGNIMLTPTGAKLLDFGLAKPSAPLATAVTLTAAKQPSSVTEQGTIVGTFQYMSPEQIEGKELDGRCDIFSLGAVLYEMLTGQRAFQGKSQLSIASAILERDPAPISSITPATPPVLDHAIRRCLAKDPEERWQTARDLALELSWMAESGGQIAVLGPANKRKTGLQWLAWGAVALSVAVALNAFLNWGKRLPVAAPVRFEIPLPPDTLNFTLSPNGRQLAIQAPGPDGRKLIWVRALDSLETRPLPGTEDVLGPPVFWSPDSRFLAFQVGNKLKKIDISGGPSASDLRYLGRDHWRRVEQRGHNHFWYRREWHYASFGGGRCPHLAYDYWWTQRSSRFSIFPLGWATFCVSQSTRKSRHLRRIPRHKTRTTEFQTNSRHFAHGGICALR